MKTVLFALFTSVFLLACSSEPANEKPSQFIKTDKLYELKGCEQLKKEVEQYNQDHPEEKPLVADC